MVTPRRRRRRSLPAQGAKEKPVGELGTRRVTGETTANLKIKKEKKKSGQE